MPVRGIRGAIQAETDTPEAVLLATRQLLTAVLEANPGLRPEDICSAWFTVTPDLYTIYPAQAARQIGWELVPLMCACEIPVPDSLARCIRVLIHWNTRRSQQAVRPVYLGAAASLRPDINRADQPSVP